MTTGTNTGIEPWLREILRCPVTHAELVDATAPDGTPELRCATPDDEGRVRAYRVEGGIPVLIPGEARFAE